MRRAAGTLRKLRRGYSAKRIGKTEVDCRVIQSIYSDHSGDTADSIRHADERGPNEYNKSLSERRAQLVKAFLAQQGISADALDTQAYGEEQNLSVDEVKQLLQQNPNLSDEERQKDMWRLKTLVLANNRRVDITLSTNGQQSRREYTFKAEDSL